MSFESDFDKIILSPHKTVGLPFPGALVVALGFHDEEYPERSTAAEEVGAFFAKLSTKASTHGVIDNDSLVGCVPYGQAAWHSGAGFKYNYCVEGYEHSGYAAQSRNEWLDAYGIQMLELSARHFAKRCHALGIPPRKIDGAQLNRAIAANDPAQGGIVGHYDMSVAGGIVGGHYDPGFNFPWDYYISRVQFYYGGGSTPVSQQEDEEVTPEDKIEIITKAAALAADLVEKGSRQLVRDPDKTSPTFGATFLLFRLAGKKIHLRTPGDVEAVCSAFGLPRHTGGPDKGKPKVDDWIHPMLNAFPTEA